MKDLSIRLTEEFGRGFSEDILPLMRRFYMAYHVRKPIYETESRKLPRSIKNQAESGEFEIPETRLMEWAEVAGQSISKDKGDES